MIKTTERWHYQGSIDHRSFGQMIKNNGERHYQMSIEHRTIGQIIKTTEWRPYQLSIKHRTLGQMKKKQRREGRTECRSSGHICKNNVENTLPSVQLASNIETERHYHVFGFFIFQNCQTLDMKAVLFTVEVVNQNI